MAKYSANAPKRVGGGPLKAEAEASGKTHEGGAGFQRGAESELFLRATSNFAGEDSFYEDATVRDAKLKELVASLSVTPDGWQWTKGFLPWLRLEGNMRSAPVLLAVEAVQARLKKNLHGDGSRQLISSVLQRADEPAEMLGYWFSTYGNVSPRPPVPKPIKRGIADAVTRLYNERGVLRYDAPDHAVRFADVIEMCRPARLKPEALLKRLPETRLAEMTSEDKASYVRTAIARQGALYQWLLAQRHGRDLTEVPPILGSIGARTRLNKFTAEKRHELAQQALEGNELARRMIDSAAASKWEWVLSWLGEGGKSGLTKAQQWELVLDQLGYMALIRNLRNLDQAGISDELAEQLAKRIADPAEVAQSRQLPFRFWSAYKEAPSLRWGAALEKALSHSLQNVPELPGETLILIDTSASMSSLAYSKRGTVTPVQAAALFALALAIKNPASADVYGFADGQFRVTNVERGKSLLKAVEAFTRCIGKVGHGTQIAAAVRNTYQPGKHKRVIIFTDMQTFPDTYHQRLYGTGDVGAAVDPAVPMYGFNLQGYSHSAMPAGHGNRHEMGGLTDHTFRLIPMIEAGQSGFWPWL